MAKTGKSYPFTYEALKLKQKVPLFSGIPVHKNDLISKTKTRRDDEGEPVLDADGKVIEDEVICCKIFGEIHVHPDNWDKFLGMLDKVKPSEPG
jgi:hypothetical protein